MHKNEHGQTLIETVVAIFIMVMGIVSALGLAVYSLNASTGITKQIVAVGLAREGLEVVKNMRDTNWLRDEVEVNCYELSGSNGITHCYDKWLGPLTGYDFALQSPSDVESFRIAFSGSAALPWSLSPLGMNEDQTSIPASQFTLDYGTTGTAGFYRPAASPSQPTSEYSRKITMEYRALDYPYNDPNDNYPLIVVTSQVWWNDRRCPVRTVAPKRNASSDVRCLVTLQTYLTNWKVY